MILWLYFWSPPYIEGIRRKEFSVNVRLEMDKLKMIAELWRTSVIGSLGGPGE